mgnify:FL=1
MLFFEIQIKRTWEKFVINLPFIEVNFFSAEINLYRKDEFHAC